MGGWLEDSWRDGCGGTVDAQLGAVRTLSCSVAGFTQAIDWLIMAGADYNIQDQVSQPRATGRARVLATHPPVVLRV